MEINYTMKTSTLIKIKDAKRTLYYKPVKPNQNGITATLVGYRKNGKDRWY